MPKPLPWSFSSLDTFVSCPRKYHEEKVLKSVVQASTEAQRAGIEIHKAFEDRLTMGAVGAPLPAKYAHHEPIVQEIEAGPGKIMAERKVALNIKLQPTGFFDKDCWYRGVLDVHKVRPDGTALIVDWKNGKKHNKMRQLWLFSMTGFIEGQTMVESMFYWTQDQSRTRIKLPAAQLPMILQSLVPDLTRYREAFRDDVWPPTPNGLCRAYCDVVGCEFHGRGLARR